MKAFTIRCGECQAKLKVDRPELIGRRVKCPKCSAKILVLSAEEAAAADAKTLPRPLEPSELAPQSSTSSVDHEEEVEVAFGDFDDIASLLAKEAKKASSPDISAAANSSSTAKPSKSAAGKKEARSANAAKASQEPQPTADGATDGSNADGPNTKLDPNWLDPNQAWTSAEVETRRRWMMLATLGIVLTVIGVVGVVWIISEFPQSPEIADAETSSNESDGQPSTDDKQTKPSQDSSSTDTNADSSADSQTSPDDASESNQEAPNAPTEGDANEPQTPDDSNVDPVAPGPNDPIVPDTTPPGFDSMPPGFDLAEPTELRPFDTLLGDLDSLGAIMEESPFDKARVMAEREMRQAYRAGLQVDDIYTDRPEGRDLKADEQLAMMLRGVELPEMELLDYLDLISDMLGLAFKVEPDALTASGSTLDTKLIVKSDEVAVGQLLTDSLATIGLGWELQGDVVVITLPNPDATETRRFDLAGIGGIAKENPELVAEVVRVMIAPESWDMASGNSVAVEFGELVVVQRPLNLWRIERFLEEWRALVNDGGAAGVAASDAEAGASTSADGDEVLDVEETARELLEVRISLEHLQAVPLRDLARELSDISGGAIIVDWVALAREGWTLDTQLVCNILDDPLGIALQDVLRPAALTYRVVDESTLQITTIRDLLVTPDVEFFDVQGLMTQGITAAEIQLQLPQVFRAVQAENSDKTFFFDPESAVLISSLPQPKQRSLAKFVAAWERFQRLATRR